MVRENGAEVLVLVEEQDLVYRDLGSRASDAHRPAPNAQRPAQWTRTIHPSEALLFRYSALTFNTHRIHYDRPYAESEGYPGLVVHGPLIATLLLGLIHAKMPKATIERFEFRAKRPAFDGAMLTLCADPSTRRSLGPSTITLWSVSDDDIGVEAEAWIR